MRCIIYWLLLINILLQACVDENFKDNPSPTPDNEIMIQLKVPGISAESRSLDEKSENAVKDLIVLAFNANGDFLYKSEARLKTDDDNNIKTCYALLKEGKQDLMFLANCKSIIESFQIPRNATKETFRSRLKITLSGKWKTDDKFTPLPMWGEKNEITIVPDMSIEDEEAIPLIRSIAKVDLTINRSEVPNDELTLKQVYLYHWSSSSRIIPDKNVWDDVNYKVTDISTGAGVYTTKEQAVLYDSSELDLDGFLTNVIYIPETAAGDKDLIPITPSLIINAEYNGENTWYRIDFLDDNKDFIPLLRNYRYEVSITGVNGKGYKTREEAYKAPSQNLKFEIIEHQDGTLTNVMYDGQYYLAWDPKELVLTREVRDETSKDNKIKLATNYPGGWKWTKTVDANNSTVNWVRLAANEQSGSTGKTTISLLIDVANPINAGDRIAFMHFSAGRMDISVKITQTDKTKVFINIFDANGNEVSGTTLWVNAIAGKEVEKLLFVEWGPAEVPCTVTFQKANDGDENVVYQNNNGINEGALTDVNGSHRYYLRFRPFDEDRDFNSARTDDITRYRTKYTFTVNYNGEIYSQDITIAHHLDMFISKFNEWYYLGLPLSAGFYSSTSYKVTSILDDSYYPIVEDAKEIENLERTLANGETINDEVDFRLKNPTWDRDNKKFLINITFPNSELPDKIVEVTGYKVFPNSYLLGKGEEAIIPVRKAWRVWKMDPINTKIPDGGIIRCGLLWEDVSGLITSVDLLQSGGVFDFETAEIKVQTSSTISNGNAVVALYRNDEIIWSWHIWVSDYNPVTGKEYLYAQNIFMDRNLGARSASSTTDKVNSLGMMYQWGRKDPFPSINRPTVTNNVPYPFLDYHKAVYNTNAAFAVKSNSTNLVDNLKRTINEPMTFLTSSNDWANSASFVSRWTIGYSSRDIGYKTNIFKNEYDPCPDGWLVPAYQKYHASPWWKEDLNQFFGSVTPVSSSGAPNGFMKGGDYYPAAGYINGQTGEYYRTWYEVFINSAHYSLNDMELPEAFLLYYKYNSNGKIEMGSANLRTSSGAPVRCIRNEFFDPQYDD